MPGPRRQLTLPAWRPRGTGVATESGLTSFLALLASRLENSEFAPICLRKQIKVVTLGRMWPFFFLLQIPVVFQSREYFFLCENTYNLKKMSKGEPTTHAKELILTPRLLPVCPWGPSLPCPHGGGNYGFKAGANRVLHPREGIRTQLPTWSTWARGGSEQMTVRRQLMQAELPAPPMSA